MPHCSCGRNFSTLSALSDHQQSKGHNKLQDEYYCQQCDKKFINKVALQQHQAAIQAFDCDTCGKRFCYEKALRSHQLSSQHCYCEPCARFFAKKESLQQHCAALHPPICGICHRKFAKIDALRDHERSTSHSLCQECGRFFINQVALKQHLESFHRSHFYCCDCNREFVDELALNQHLHDKIHPDGSRSEPVTYQCSKCTRSFKSMGALNQHLASLAHKPLSDVKCVASTQCNRRFSSPSALIQHLESGGCCSGLNRKKLNLLVQRNDVDRVISDGIGNNGLLTSAKHHADSDSDLDSDSDSDSCNGVPIYTPVSSQAPSPILTPTMDGTLSTIVTRNISNDSLLTGLFTPRSSLDPSELGLPPAIIGLFCPLCPPTRKAFHNNKALEMHLASPKHGPKLFHCPSSLLAPTKTGRNHGTEPARFTTLSGLTLHIESGACKGGKAALKAAIGLLEERLKDMGFQNPALLKI